MVGFRLGNTITENGTVSRGECVVGKDGMLQSVTERTKIKATESGAAYLDDDGTTWVDLSADTIVSMNCWGFTPALFGYMETDFAGFLKDMGPDPMKAEYFLPFSVDTQRKMGLCDVKVYPTSSQWLGVTYPEDKESVKTAIKELIKNGEYPNGLWN